MNQNPKSKKTLIIIAVCLFAVAAALVTTLIIMVFNNKKPKALTFDFTCAQYSEKINSVLGDEVLNSSNWKISEASALYEVESFSIDLGIDRDSKKVTQIDVGPADADEGTKIAGASLMVIDPDMSQRNAASKLPEFRQGNRYIFIPTEDPHKPTSPTTTSVPTEPSSIAGSTAPQGKEYTAIELNQMKLDKIVELMGGDFTCRMDGLTPAFGTSGVLWMYNDTALPGFAFYPDTTFEAKRDKLDEAKQQLLNKKYKDYIGISLTGSAKLNDTITASMSYNELAAILGDFDVKGAGQETYTYATKIDGYQVYYVFHNSPELEKYYKNDKITAADLKKVNPPLHSIGLQHSKPTQPTTTTVPKTTAATAPRTVPTTVPKTTAPATTAPATTTPEANWKTLYKKAVNDFKTSIDSEPSYALVEINGDNIPELIIDGVAHMDGKHLYWISDGVLHTERIGLAWGELKYSEHAGTFWNLSNAQGASYSLYSLGSSNLELLHTANYYMNDSRYEVDGQTVDEDKYNEMVEEITSQCSDEPTFYHSKEEILSAIDQY